MKHIFIRPLRMYDEDDKRAFVVAADACGKEFPANLFTLPSTRIMVAETGGEIVMYQPQFVSLNLGSLIPAGAPSSAQMAEAQHQLVSAAYLRAHADGLADIIAFSNNPATRQFALRHGFTATSDALRMEIR